MEKKKINKQLRGEVLFIKVQKCKVYNAQHG